MSSHSFSVSVIIPVYNGEAFLAEAMQNIQQQNYQLLEIIVVDDGSSDRTAEIAANFSDQVRYVFQPNAGPAAARNKGLEMAQGDVIAFLDVDDLWTENKLNLQLEHLAQDPLRDIVLGHVQVMQRTEVAPEQASFVKFGDPCVASNLGCAVFRKSVFEKVGFFDPALRYSEDVDWFMRAREQGIPMLILEQVTLLYRLHQQNMTHRKNLHDLSLMKVLKNSLDRRRKTRAVSFPA